MWDDNYPLMRLAGLCGGWLAICLTYAVGQGRVTLRMLFALVFGFAILFAMARPFIN
jgi:hypothetical protein